MDRTLKAKFEKAAEESRRQLEELNERYLSLVFFYVYFSLSLSLSLSLSFPLPSLSPLRASKLKERSEKRIDYILHVGGKSNKVFITSRMS